MAKDNDIDQYEKKENAPEKPQPVSILAGFSLPDLEDVSAENIGIILRQMSATIMLMRNRMLSHIMAGKKLNPDDEYKVNEADKQFNAMNKMYKELQKSGVVGNVAAQQQAQQSESDFLKLIKQSASTIGPIQRDTRERGE